MNSVATGQQAEIAAAIFFAKRGYKVLQRNWKTRYCEVDIVAAASKKIWFVEVKYRRQDGQGTGIDYITQQKLKRMHFAAEMWVHRYQWNDDYELAAIEVSGPSFMVTDFTSC